MNQPLIESSSVRALQESPDFDLLLNLATITAHYELQLQVFGSVPARDDTNLSSKAFWHLWDSGFAIIDELVRRRRLIRELKMSNCSWNTIAAAFKEKFYEEYQFCLPVSIHPSEFDQLCQSIYHENDVLIGSYRLKPLRYDEVTDPYGVDMIGTIWGLSEDGVNFDECHSGNKWDLAQQVYNQVNGHEPDKSSYGVWAERLDFISWSIYDPPYVPLRKREQIE